MSASHTKTRRRSRRRLLYLLAGVLFVAAQLVLWTQPSIGFNVAERLAPNVVWRAATRQPLVALSFDDGPHPTHTPKVLDILERHGVRATFFLVGERARTHPDVVQRIKAAGHEVGNHYFMDALTLGHSDTEFLDYLERTEQAIIPGPRKLFRPPSGIAWPGQLRLARARGYTTVLGSVYPHDPMRPPAWYIEWLVAKNLAPGAIVILHDGIPDPSRSIDALPRILEAGKQKGLRFAPIGELMSHVAKEAAGP